jgi:hypothetical protein
MPTLTPGPNVFDILLGDLVVIALTQRRLEHHADGKGQFGKFDQPGLLQRIQSIDDVLGLANIKYITSFKEIFHHELLFDSLLSLWERAGEAP